MAQEKTTVTVIVGDEKWERFHNGEQFGGTSKNDKDYLTKTVEALEEALKQAKFELSLTS